MTLERQRHFHFKPVLLADGVRKGVDGLGMDGLPAHFLQDTKTGRGTRRTAEQLKTVRGYVRSETSISGRNRGAMSCYTGWCFTSAIPPLCIRV